jgi:hypothetical protein
LPERALDAEGSAEEPHPFTHASAAEAVPRLRCVDVESDPVVAYRQQQTAVLEGETYDRNTGPGVTRDISQSLLHNAKDA